MGNDRREFLKLAGLTGIGLTSGGMLDAFALDNHQSHVAGSLQLNKDNMSIIGLYGPWASSINENKIPSHSFRRSEYKDLEVWRSSAKERLKQRLAIPDIGGIPKVSLKKKYEFDGLHIEELTWQLPYGNPTDAIVLKPSNSKGRLPAVLAFHDHGGNKYFGVKKITRTSTDQHPLMKLHQEEYYSGLAWANELAKKGYVVFVSDAFTFGSRRVMMADVPTRLADGLTDNNPDDPKNIRAYNDWASNHEHIMAKSLFCAGTTWPGVFFAEDVKALDILSMRDDVDATRIGCCGLSGGGLRTVFMGGLDPRIKCAVDVGFMSTWKDFLLNKSYTHTWMLYVPLLPNEMDFPEILGLRVPLPTLVLNDNEDDLYTLPEMQRADSILKEVYKKAGVENAYKCSYYPGPHKFDVPMQKEAFAWFDKWLKA